VCPELSGLAQSWDVYYGNRVDLAKWSPCFESQYTQGYVLVKSLPRDNLQICSFGTKRPQPRLGGSPEGFWAPWGYLWRIDPNNMQQNNDRAAEMGSVRPVEYALCDHNDFKIHNINADASSM